MRTELNEDIHIIQQALADWLAIFAGDLYEDGAKEAAKKRISGYGTILYISNANAAILRVANRLRKLKKLDSEAAEFVEVPIISRTKFTGEPPYVGWKGLGLALNEALDERDRLRELARKVNEAPIGTVELYQTQHDGDDPFIEFEIRGSIECPTTYAGKRYKLVEVE